MLDIYCLFYYLLTTLFVLFVNANQVTFQLNDLAKQLTGKEIVCNREGYTISLLEATNGTFQSPCFQCICKNKNLICSRKLCPPIPSNCPLIVQSPNDECCQECAACVDERNQRREHGSLWPASRNTCSRYTCETGIKTLSRMECINTCSKEVGFQSQAYCCRLCPVIEKRDQFPISEDPCVRCETIGGFWEQCYRLACPVLNCAPDEQRHSSKHCCPKCAKRREIATYFPQTKSTCQFRHLNYIRGQRFRPDPCSQCECTAVGLECRRYVCPVDCPGGYYRPQVCCPFCGHLKRNQSLLPQYNVHSQCVIRLNATQMVWKENDHWSPDACTKCTCTRGQVSCQSQVCPQVKCDEQKQKKVTPVGQCCPVCIDLKRHQKDGSGLCKLATKDSQLRTFDGSELEVKQPCSFILTQQCLFDSQLPLFVIKLHNNQQGLLQKLSIELNEQSGVRLGTLNVLKGKDLKYRGRRIKLPQRTGVFYATFEKGRFTLDLNQLGIKIVWMDGKVVRLHADRKYFSSLCGLCGNFNGLANDDLLPRFAMNVTVNVPKFVESWQSDDSECGEQEKLGKKDDFYSIDSNTDKKSKNNDLMTKSKDGSCSHLLSKANKPERRRYAQNCAKLKRSPLLATCSSHLSVHKFVKQCIVDVCECEKMGMKTKRVAEKIKDPCYCRSLNLYAEECAKHGLLTLGSAITTMNNNTSIRIHAKCPAIQLVDERKVV